jgi:hypothetical protein
MTDAALDHPLVRAYLRQLDIELTALPPAQAAELREQIRSHLDEELAPDATDAVVAEAIRRLGTAHEVAAAAEPRPRPELSAREVVRWLIRPLTARTLRFWTVTAAGLIAATTVTGVIGSAESAPALSFGGETAWLYRQDYLHEVDTTADGAQQAAVPNRTGQRQGFAISIDNDSGWTQTVIGLTSPDEYMFSGTPNQLRVSTRTFAHNWPGDPRSVRYALPVSIPPGQTRFLRLTWVSACEVPGGSEGIDQLTLRVRVGWFTRTEVIPLNLGLYLLGTAQSRCPNE